MRSSCPLTVVVNTRGRPAAAASVLFSVCAQAEDDVQIVVVDQSAPHDVAALAAALGEGARVERHVAAADGLPAGRNRALAVARGRVVLFLDDDVIVQPGLLQAHVAAYADPEIGGAVGRIRERVVPTNAPPGTCRIGWDGRARTHLDGDVARDVDSLKGANMSVRRAALAAVGGFDAGYGGSAVLEEADLAARLRAAGWRLRYAPDATVDHLSLPAGGCRVADVRDAEAWRFRNTGRFVRRNRPAATPLVALAFAAIAARKAWTWRDPVSGPALWRAWWASWGTAQRR